MSDSHVLCCTLRRFLLLVIFTGLCIIHNNTEPHFENLTFGVIICDDRVGGHKLNFKIRFSHPRCC